MNTGQRRRATCRFEPVDHLLRREFYIWDEALLRWQKEGLPKDYRIGDYFSFDDDQRWSAGEAAAGLNLGWTEAPLFPEFEVKVLKDEGDKELIQDIAGRQVRVFKGRRHGFMPEYVKHAVTCMQDWEADVLPRLNPADPARYAKLRETCALAAGQVRDHDYMATQGMIGGYMYLRSLMGPEDLCYAFVEQPELIHAMMKQWAALMDEGLARVQSLVELDEIQTAEDICYNNGLLISPAMVREFLFPYYRSVIGNARARQKKQLYWYLDTDGRAEDAIPLYLEVGVDGMGPWEVAAGCDVVKIGGKYPKLILMGGIDKRVLALDKKAIDEHLEYVIPAMVRRGGFIPTCDHGVPDNVSLENYLYYRKRMVELDGKAG